jgi:hypothetical protein
MANKKSANAEYLEHLRVLGRLGDEEQGEEGISMDIDSMAHDLLDYEESDDPEVLNHDHSDEQEVVRPVEGEGGEGRPGNGEDGRTDGRNKVRRKGPEEGSVGEKNGCGPAFDLDRVLSSFWGEEPHSDPTGQSGSSTDDPSGQRDPPLTPFMMETASYEEGRRIVPPGSEDHALTVSLYTNSLALAVSSPLPPGSNNYQTLHDPIWDGDRRCDVRVLREWHAISQDADSLVRSSAMKGICYGCDQVKEGSHSLIGGNQEVLIVADTYFPPIVGGNGNCIPVLRVQISTPQHAELATIKYFGETKSQRIHPKVRRSLKPRSPLIILCLTAHLRRVGVHSYLESMRGMCKSLKNTLERQGKGEFSIGLMVMPFMKDGKTDRDALARDSAVLANVMCAAKEQSKNKLPLFVDGYLAMLMDETSDMTEYVGVGVNVPAGCPLIGNQNTILTSPFIRIRGSLGFSGTPAYGSALTPGKELEFLTQLVKEIELYKGTDTDFVTPDLEELGQGVSEGFPRNGSEQESRCLQELIDLGVGLDDTKTKYKDIGIIAVCGNSEALTLKGGLNEQFTGLPAQAHWKCQSIEVKNTDRTPAPEKILGIALEKFGGAGKEGGGEPIVILRFLEAEILGVRPKLKPVVIGKYNRRHAGNKRPREGQGNHGRQSGRRICIEAPALKTPEELVPMLKALEHLVVELTQESFNVIIVGPFPRHFTPCCLDESHFGKDFPHADYVRTVYELSTFLRFMPELKSAWLLHPGDVLGWERPSEVRSVKPDGVHLSESAAKTVNNKVAEFIKNIRSKPESVPSRITVPEFDAESFPRFVRETRGRGKSFNCPPE